MVVELTQAKLKEHMHYDPDTGVFTWVKPTTNRVKAGDVVGTLGKGGYVFTALFGQKQYLHRLAWLYCYGELPSAQVDHIDHDRANNRLANLRIATNQENARNQKRRRSNSSGVTGVSWYRATSKWQVGIYVDGRRKHVGHFEELDAAVAAYAKAKRQFGYHNNHGKV